MVTNHDQIYQHKSRIYDLLISKQPSLYQIIQQIRPTKGLDIVDLGAGTGRLTKILAPQAKSILAVDASAAMLKITAEALQKKGLSNWRTLVADHRHLPIADQSADLLVAGWSICYLASSNNLNWKENIRQVLKEMFRLLRPGGMIIMFETMGTATSRPEAPDFLKSYYAILEDQFHFSHQVIRLDYHFDDLEQAVKLTRFFFGDEIAHKVSQDEQAVVSEYAGVWWNKRE